MNKQSEVSDPKLYEDSRFSAKSNHCTPCLDQAKFSMTMFVLGLTSCQQRFLYMTSFLVLALILGVTAGSDLFFVSNWNKDSPRILTTECRRASQAVTVDLKRRTSRAVTVDLKYGNVKSQHLRTEYS